ncbi:MAG TPA: hypothetical protein VHO43_04545 [Ignavibacteriales bacterium]|nr:hypothetical protein [Ignavibacteriales bacterium]
METEFESVLLSFYRPDMISYMDNHPEEFEEAILLAVSGKQPFAWRAAWLLGICMEENDKRIKAYTELIIRSLADKTDGHQRELIKILSKMELNEDQKGFLFDFCVNLWKDIYKQPSMRSTALKIIVKIAKQYPDLSKEVALLTKDQYLNTLSPAIKKSVPKILKELDQKI